MSKNIKPKVSPLGPPHNFTDEMTIHRISKQLQFEIEHLSKEKVNYNRSDLAHKMVETLASFFPKNENKLHTIVNQEGDMINVKPGNLATTVFLGHGKLPFHKLPITGKYEDDNGMEFVFNSPDDCGFIPKSWICNLTIDPKIFNKEENE